MKEKRRTQRRGWEQVFLLLQTASRFIATTTSWGGGFIGLCAHLFLCSQFQIPIGPLRHDKMEERWSEEIGPERPNGFIDLTDAATRLHIASRRMNMESFYSFPHQNNNINRNWNNYNKTSNEIASCIIPQLQTMSYKITPGTVPQLQHIELFCTNIYIHLSYTRQLILFSDVFLFPFFIVGSCVWLCCKHVHSWHTKQKKHI